MMRATDSESLQQETSSHPDREQFKQIEDGSSSILVDDHEFVESDPVMSKPRFDWETICNYSKTRFTYLFPSLNYIKTHKSELNPIPALREVPGKQWLVIFCATMAWAWDAFDFFTVTLNVDNLSELLHRDVKDITMGITLVLMLRSAGAVTFGALGDRFGTRWPFVANLVLMAAIQLGFSFIQTYEQFLGVRAAFGFVMGGIYGSAAALALNDCPSRPRGFVSGVVQQGYAFGYLLAAIFARALGDTQKYKWRAVYWFAACVSVILAVWRALLPETQVFKEKLAARKAAMAIGDKSENFFKKAGRALKIYWLICIYLVIMMVGFSFMSHGSQDLYPTYLSKQLKFSEDAETVTMCVANIGALVGGILVGHVSSLIGRRLSIIICCICGGALVYPWGFVHNTGINAAAFFLQFFVQGAFGVIPAHLIELAHPDFEIIIVGLAYQLGNLASSASSTIESDIGESFPLPGGIYNYGKVMAILMGCVFAFVLIIVLVGPENSRAVRAIAMDRHRTGDVSQEPTGQEDNKALEQSTSHKEYA